MINFTSNELRKVCTRISSKNSKSTEICALNSVTFWLHPLILESFIKKVWEETENL